MAFCLAKCRHNADFGRGIYTTTFEEQAEAWSLLAADRFAGKHMLESKPAPAVLKFEVDRDKLAELSILFFVRPTADYWDLVSHCRNSPPGHARMGGQMYYDVVAGPISKGFAQKIIWSDYDQISFHTDAACTLLYNSISREQDL